MNIRKILCPQCLEWWMCCPCCSEEFCPRCGMKKHDKEVISNIDNPAEFQREYERLWEDEGNDQVLL